MYGFSLRLGYVSNDSVVKKLNGSFYSIFVESSEEQADKWLQFSETFEAVINKNTSITNVQKFYYLQSSLKGEATHCIHSLQVSESNYTVAWQLLQDRYYNKRIIIHTHVRPLFEYTNVNR